MLINKRGEAVPVWKLFRSQRVGCLLVIESARQCWGLPLYFSGVRLPSGEYVIVAAPQYSDSALEDYRVRWGIETLFGCLKSRGFRLEETHVTNPERLAKLLALLALAFSWAHLVGEWLAQAALAGGLTSAQRFVLGELLQRYDEIEAAIARVEEHIDEEVATCRDPFVAEAVELLETIVGVGETVAEVTVSEIGVERSRFATDGHLASWAGMCPGNDESAGKKRSGKATKGSSYLRAALIQAGWAASHQKGTYLAGQYQRLVKRMRKKKALVAVGHSMLVIISHVLQKRASYEELGGDYFDRQDVVEQRARLIDNLAALGLKGRVAESPAAA